LDRGDRSGLEQEGILLFEGICKGWMVDCESVRVVGWSGSGISLAEGASAGMAGWMGVAEGYSSTTLKGRSGDRMLLLVLVDETCGEG